MGSSAGRVDAFDGACVIGGAKLIRLLIVGGSVVGLEILCRAGVIGAFTMIPPSEMLLSAVRQLGKPDVLQDLGFTLSNMAGAIAVAIVGGFGLGLVLHAIPRLRAVVSPLLASWYAVPTFVFYPLLVVLFGLNRGPLIALGALFGVVAMLVNTLDGLDRLPRAVVKTGRAMRLGPLRSAVLIKLPASAPHLVAGVKLAVAYAIIGVVAAEFILATAGIGRRIALAFNDLDNPTMYGLLLVLIVIVVAINMTIAGVERRLQVRWGRS
jgi:NitT/TauT family transport system permease protein